MSIEPFIKVLTYRCHDCGAAVGVDEVVGPLYECGSCGETADDPDDIICPTCHRLMVRVFDDICPACEGPIDLNDEVIIMYETPDEMRHVSIEGALAWLADPLRWADA